MSGILRKAVAAAVLAALSACAAGVAVEPPPRVPPDAQAPGGYLAIEAVPIAAATGRQVGRWALYLDGYIESGATSRLVALLDREHIGHAVVYFNSPGGSLLEAMALGRAIRARGFDTDVGRRGEDAARPLAGSCYSACPFAYAGGVRRSLDPGSVLGVHLAENRSPVPDEAAFQRRVMQDASSYLAAMGVDPGLLGLMTSAPHDRIRPVSDSEALALGLVNSHARSTP